MARGTGGFLQPEEIVKQLNIGKEAVIADYGCGAGYFTIPLAKIAEKGIVYAFDILDTALESVKGRAKLERLFNIETKQCNLEEPNASGLADNSIDLILLANILFQSSKKTDIIKEAKRILKQNGEIVIIDWKPNQPMGPPSNLIISPDKIKEITKNQGLSFKREFPVDKYHWGAVFINNQ
jgi:ubiquinone/menaquinone biosynthesis C-methylase UbiE